MAVYIRDALPDDDARHQQIEQIAQQIREAGAEFLLFLETVEAAEHAAKKGWIAKDAITNIQ